MNVPELERCAAAVKRRIEATLGDADDRLFRLFPPGDDGALAQFAGTGLPARAVLVMLENDAVAAIERLDDGRNPPWLIVKSSAINAFWLGYEAGRRS